MNIPNHATFTDGNLKVKNHGMYLHGFTDAAEHVSVQIRQWDIADLEYAGRLFFNHSLVEVRSEREALILELLRTSAFAPVEIEQSIRTDHIPGPITDPQMLSRVRDEIVDHVSSDEYVKIATVGIEVTPPPWMAWVKP
ncbi:MAG: hypothetical protein R3C49_23810 [Planctomycetaceae bacterium]